MIAFLISPIGRSIALGAIALLAIFGALLMAERRGAEKAVQKIERANSASETMADKAERSVLDCPPGKWNREARKCEP
jgi:hypothetical protein